jgi:uncharacterized YigZ family protein
MQSIKDTVTYTHIEKKSEFISVLKRVNDENEAKEVLTDTRAAHPDAAHHCYAYILGDDARIQKASDDGEPSKTAGKPILDVLHKNDLTDVILIVIRYYGGVKLGAGGLIRAYSKSAREAVDRATFVNKRGVIKAKVTVSYADSADIASYLRTHTTLTDETYLADVTYTFLCYKDDFETIKKAIGARTGYRSAPMIIGSESRYV